MSLIRAHAFVTGLVQGVFFRASTQEQATDLGLRGYVRNLSDGRVEVLVEGEEFAVDQLVQWLWHGPPGAEVEKVEVDTIPITALEHENFHIR